MKITLTAIILLAAAQICFSQNTGIGTTTPQEKLEVSGAIKIGNTLTNNPGTIRYDGTYKGYNGTRWLPMESYFDKVLLPSYTLLNLSNDIERLSLAAGNTALAATVTIGSANTTVPQLDLRQIGGLDYSSMRFSSWNDGANSWDFLGRGGYVPANDYFFIRYTGTGDLMTFNGGGNIGISCAEPAAKLHITGNSGLNGVPQLLLQETENDYARLSFRNTSSTYWDVAGLPASSNTGAAFNFFYSGLNSNILSLKGDGKATFYGQVTAAGILLTSDERLKKNITPIDNVMPRLEHIDAFTYQWKDSTKDQESQIGFLAQQVEKTFPQLVKTDESGSKAVAYMSMVPLLLQAIKEQQKKIEALEKKMLSITK